MQYTDKDARDIVQKEGKISLNALKIVRQKQFEKRMSALGGAAGDDDDAAAAEAERSGDDEEYETVFDDDQRVKLKMMVYLEALLSAVNLGITL